MKGKKYDTGKPMWYLIPKRTVGTIVGVLTAGATKYGDDNWKKVESPRDRYYSALMRHVDSWRDGCLLDHETKLPHLAHAACCILFLMWFDNNEDKQK